MQELDDKDIEIMQLKNQIEQLESLVSFLMPKTELNFILGSPGHGKSFSAINKITEKLKGEL